MAKRRASIAIPLSATIGMRTWSKSMLRSLAPERLYRPPTAFCAIQSSRMSESGSPSNSLSKVNPASEATCSTIPASQPTNGASLGYLIGAVTIIVLRSKGVGYKWVFAIGFGIPDIEKDGQWMTAAAIHQVIKRYAGSAIKNGNIRRFGRFLANVDGLRQRRTRFGMEYFVSQKPLK